MTWTWQEIISQALVLSGILGRGQPASSAQSSDAINTAGLLLDEWDGQGLALPAFDSDITFNTVAGRSKYILGPGTTPDFAVRPESIITATLTITTNVKSQMARMSYADYTLIAMASIQGQPWNYAVNDKWPQAELFLYPTPSAVYPVILNCKIKWGDTLTAPDVNPFAIAQAPSGYAAALVDNLALKLAEKYRLQTDTLISRAASSRYTIAQGVVQQMRGATGAGPQGVFSDAIIRAGRNP